ncbi:MAG: DUF4177 domain-containing protein [Oscillospiraceae bacterium]
MLEYDYEYIEETGKLLRSKAINWFFKELDKVIKRRAAEGWRLVTTTKPGIDPRITVLVFERDAAARPAYDLHKSTLPAEGVYKKQP